MKYWERRVLYFVRRLRSRNPSTRLRAANQILDMCGITPTAPTEWNLKTLEGVK